MLLIIVTFLPNLQLKMSTGVGKKLRDVPCEFCTIKHYDTSRYYSHANKHHFEIIEKSWIKCELCKVHSSISIFKNFAFHPAPQKSSNVFLMKKVLNF